MKRTWWVQTIRMGLWNIFFYDRIDKLLLDFKKFVRFKYLWRNWFIFFFFFTFLTLAFVINKQSLMLTDGLIVIYFIFIHFNLLQVRESAFASIKVLLLKKYLNASRIEEFVCPTSVQLLNLEGLPEDVVRERHPDAFVVSIIIIFFFLSFFVYILSIFIVHMCMNHRS